MREGATELPFTADAGQAGPAARDGGPFYNPAMAGNRDLSVLLVELWARRRGRQLDVADVLAGAGARSLRLANEVDADIVVHANDGDPGAVASLLRGKAELGLGPLHAQRGNAHAFLASRRFDVVDVDPYGTPAPFVDAAVRATRHGGLVCLTATDTAALAGTYPRVCRRRYGAWHGLHGMAWRHEVGLRILAGAAVMAAGRHDRAARPVLSVSRSHWMRVVLEIRDGRGAADAALRQLGSVVADRQASPTLEEGGRLADPRGVIAMGAGLGTPTHGPWAGPLWLGPLHDGGLVQDMLGAAPAHTLHPSTPALLRMLGEEAGAPPFWASLPHLRARLGHDLPARDVLARRLEQAGCLATRTHMDPQGLRTDADWQTLTSVARTE